MYRAGEAGDRLHTVPFLPMTLKDGCEMRIDIPYGRSALRCEVQDARLKGVLKPRSVTSGGDGVSLVKEAMAHPIGSPRLEELARGKRRILIIASDHTRPVPSRVIMPLMLSELRAGSPDAHIKILIATGFHRETTREELAAKFGGLADSLDIEMHVARDTASMVYKGVLPSGGQLWLNRLVDWAELVVSEGFIEPHFFAGFSGGRKSVLPGVASQETVFANHCSKFIGHPRARTGILEGNPIHEDMVFAAKTVGLRYIVNVAIDSQKRIVSAYAGDPFAAHAEGCEYVSRHSAVDRVQGDIVIASNGGYPLDQNIYQAVKGMTAAESCVRPGGVIVMCAACSDGHGGEDFYRWFTKGGDPAQVLGRILAIEQMETLPDQWEAQILARILCHAKVILVCDQCARQFAEDMGMLYAPSLEAALEAADAMTNGGDIVAIPDGVGVIVGG